MSLKRFSVVSQMFGIGGTNGVVHFLVVNQTYEIGVAGTVEKNNRFIELNCMISEFEIQ